MGSRKKKGYSIGLCIAFNEWGARVYQLLSLKSKLIKNITLGKKYVNFDQKELYKFNESIIDIIRPLIREQNRAIVIVAPKKSKYFEYFSLHIKKGHRWLDSVAFEQFDAEIQNNEQMHSLFQNEQFKQAIGIARAEESAVIEHDLNKYLNKLEDASREKVIYGLQDLERFLLDLSSANRKVNGILLISEEFLESRKGHPKMQRVRQLAKNKGIAEKNLRRRIRFGPANK